MTCTTNERTWIRGSEEYLAYEITADVDLDSQPVALTFDRTTFVDMEWVGAVAHTRTARVLLTDTQLPDASVVEVFIRVTDNPEIPLVPAGTLTVI